MLLCPYLTSVISLTCCLNTCPLQVQTIQSLSVVLPQPSQHIINNAFLDALDDWLQPPDSHCRRKFRSQPSQGTPLQRGCHTRRKRQCKHVMALCRCEDEHPCLMLNSKSFLVFSVDLLHRGGYLKLSNTPPSVSVFGRSFKLYGVTLWNGGHYICIFYFKNNWYMYDGLQESTRKGSGVQVPPVMYHEPLAFSLSFLIYCS